MFKIKVLIGRSNRHKYFMKLPFIPLPVHYQHVCRSTGYKEPGGNRELTCEPINHPTILRREEA